MKKLKILANLSRYDYGDIALGDSFEYSTFYAYFKAMGHRVELFDYYKWFNKGGKKLVHDKLLAASKCDYDMIFSVPLGDQISFNTLDKIKRSQSGAISIAWMCDDKWRWRDFGSVIAPHFDFVITTDPDSVDKYHSIGYYNVIASQWACNVTKFKKTKSRKMYDVSFIGGISGWRSYVVDSLKKNNVNVSCFGNGWEHGKVSVDEMVSIYNQSKIVLNLSNSTRFDVGYLFHISKWPKSGSLKEKIAQTFPGVTEYILSKKREEDIKARFFEVLGCGAFLLSYDVVNLDKYLKSRVDFDTYTTIDDLLKKVKYYLSNEVDREKIATRGYKKVITKHTYANRFDNIFQTLKLK